MTRPAISIRELRENLRLDSPAANFADGFRTLPYETLLALVEAVQAAHQYRHLAKHPRTSRQWGLESVKARRDLDVKLERFDFGGAAE